MANLFKASFRGKSEKTYASQATQNPREDVAMPAQMNVYQGDVDRLTEMKEIPQMDLENKGVHQLVDDTLLDVFRDEEALDLGLKTLTESLGVVFSSSIYLSRWLYEE